ncbi:MAG TPA: redox-sensing transcriptional repressor Rex, partial [Negativicutes bacterium]
MRKISFYNKNGISKSTTASRVAVALAEKNHSVCQINGGRKNELPLIADATLNRLGTYLVVLKQLPDADNGVISSSQLAQLCGTTSENVRKDLSVLKCPGKKGVGYDIILLTKFLERVLGCDCNWNAVVVGSYLIWKHYSQFMPFQYKISGVFDINPSNIGDGVRELQSTVSPIKRLREFTALYAVDIGIITTDFQYAQTAADQLIKEGVRAILNLTPAILRHDPETLVVNISTTFALSKLS